LKETLDSAKGYYFSFFANSFTTGIKKSIDIEILTAPKVKYLYSLKNYKDSVPQFSVTKAKVNLIA